VIQDERVVFANHVMSQISGYTVEEIQVLSPQELRDFVYSEDRRLVWDNHIARLDGRMRPENCEFRIVRKDGTVRWMELHACRIEYEGRPAIHATCADVTARMQPQIARLGIAVVRDLAEDLPKARCDAVGIQQVTLNLMGNALEAMSECQAPVRNLTVSTRAAGDNKIEIAVADTGRGPSAQLTERVFDSFFTTKNEGLGIGLSLSRRIVEAHGGRLWAEANEGSDKVFRFTLPAEGAKREQHKTHCICRR